MATGPVNRPQAWRIRPSEAARFTADGQHCETRRCREPVAIITWRWWRSAAARRVLVSEHQVCERHGAEFAVRYHIGVDPAGEVTARHLSDVEMLAFWVEHRHCDCAGMPDRSYVDLRRELLGARQAEVRPGSVLRSPRPGFRRSVPHRHRPGTR